MQCTQLELSRHDKAMIAVNLSCVIFLISTITWLAWSAFSVETAQQRRSNLFRVCYALYGFMDVFCIGKYSTAKTVSYWPCDVNSVALFKKDNYVYKQYSCRYSVVRGSTHAFAFKKIPTCPVSSHSPSIPPGLTSKLQQPFRAAERKQSL